VGVKRNVTVQLDGEVITKAKVLAAKRGTSISGLVAAEITRLTEQNERYERAREAALARLAAPADYSSDDMDGESTERRWPRGPWSRPPQLIVSASLLHERHSFAFWDAMIVEAALLSGATTLLSEDLQDGRRIGDLTITNPFRPADP
jgi:hypothetical protein